MRLILCIIAAEALTQLTCKAEIFNRPREWVKSLSLFTNDLLSCPYCDSVWVATFTTVIYFAWDSVYLFVIMLVIHRMSNVLHDIFRIVFNVKLDQVLKR